MDSLRRVDLRFVKSLLLHRLSRNLSMEDPERLSEYVYFSRSFEGSLEVLENIGVARELSGILSLLCTIMLRLPVGLEDTWLMTLEFHEMIVCDSQSTNRLILYLNYVGFLLHYVSGSYHYEVGLLSQKQEISQELSWLWQVALIAKPWL